MWTSLLVAPTALRALLEGILPAQTHTAPADPVGAMCRTEEVRTACTSRVMGAGLPGNTSC